MQHLITVDQRSCPATRWSSGTSIMQAAHPHDGARLFRPVFSSDDLLGTNGTALLRGRQYRIGIGQQPFQRLRPQVGWLLIKGVGKVVV